MWKNIFIVKPFSFSLYNNDPDHIEPDPDHIEPVNEAINSADASDSSIVPENNELKDVLQPSLEAKEKLNFSNDSKEIKSDSKEIKSLTIKDKLFNRKFIEQIGLVGLGLGISFWLIILLYRIFGSRKFY